MKNILISSDHVFKIELKRNVALQKIKYCCFTKPKSYFTIIKLLVILCIKSSHSYIKDAHLNSEAWWRPCQTSMMEIFANIVIDKKLHNTCLIYVECFALTLNAVKYRVVHVLCIFQFIFPVTSSLLVTEHPSERKKETENPIKNSYY